MRISIMRDTSAAEDLRKCLAEIEDQEKAIKSALKIEINKQPESERNQLKIDTLQQALNKYQEADKKLSNALLKDIAMQLKPLESQLKEGLRDLEDVSRDIENTVEIIEVVNKGTRIVSRILGFIPFGL